MLVGVVFFEWREWGCGVYVGFFVGLLGVVVFWEWVKWGLLFVVVMLLKFFLDF